MPRPRKRTAPPVQPDYTAPVAELLPAWRAWLGLTQERAAGRLRVSPSALRAWEQGCRTPDAAHCLRISLWALAEAEVPDWVGR